MRCQGANPLTAEPRRSTRATISWPGTIGSFGSGSSPSTTCRSVRHTPQASTRSAISVAAGSGVARSSRRSGRPGSPRTMAFIVVRGLALRDVILQLLDHEALLVDDGLHDVAD